MKSPRKIESISKGITTRDGAGVKLKRIFGHSEADQLDPFLLLDYFGSDNPDEYMAGFPWHPHRGIETITYMMNGKVKHEDSLGNGGVIETGDVQWMTAGSGIIHQEMPERSDGAMTGFQLWANLPSSHKMMDPRYRDVKAEDIVEVEMDGVRIKIIAGKIGDAQGPVRDVVIEPEYLDVSIGRGARFEHPIPEGHTVFAYVFEGQISFGGQNTSADNLVIFGNGEGILAESESGGRFLLVSGKPLNEPIAWYGPIVMNTKEELDLALKQYRNGTFIKHK
jgi:redox-sensitive bicupin YhaK (pirin superfamily)